MKTIAFDEIQTNLRYFMQDDIKPDSKKGLLVEHAYVRALVDANVEIPVIVPILVSTGRSIVSFKVSPVVA